MSPQNKQLRVVELLPGGEQITSRPLHVVAYVNDHGEAVVQKPEEGGPEDMLDLLSTLLAATAARLAAEAQQRADVAGMQAAWQEGRAHGLRAAAAITAAAADTRPLRDDIRGYIASLEEQADAADTMSQHLADRDGVRSAGLYEGRGLALRQVAEALRGLLVADEPEGAGDE